MSYNHKLMLIGTTLSVQKQSTLPLGKYFIVFFVSDVLFKMIESTAKGHIFKGIDFSPNIWISK